MEVIQFVQAHWIEWIFAVVTSLLGFTCQNLARKVKQQQKKNDAIGDGVQALLRESIVDNYNKYQNRGNCPIYAKEAMKKSYSAYHKLGGNDVATQLYETFLAMPEEPKEG